MESSWAKGFKVMQFINSTMLTKCTNKLISRRIPRKGCSQHGCLPSSTFCSERYFGAIENQKNTTHFKSCGPSLHWVSQRKTNLKRNYSHFSVKQLWQGGQTKRIDGVQDSARGFVEHENEYFHSWLQSVPEYQPYLLKYQSTTEAVTCPPDTVNRLLHELKDNGDSAKLLLLLQHWSAVACFRSVSVLKDAAFQRTVHLLQKHIQWFNADEVLQGMTYLNFLGFRQKRSTSFANQSHVFVSKAFDEACTLHITTMNVRNLLLAADFFYCVRGSMFVKFNPSMFNRIKRLLPSMTKSELIMLLFHISLTRSCAPDTVYLVVSYLQNDWQSLTLEEVAIVNLAHYKSRCFVKEPQYFNALSQLMKKKASLEADSLCLSAVLKYHRRNVSKYKDNFVPQFFTALQDIEVGVMKQIPGLSPQTVARMLKLYYSTDLLSEDLFTAVLDRITHTGVQDWRLKDIAKVMQILTNIPMESERKVEALEAILTELQRKGRSTEREDHLESLLQIATTLSFCGMYRHWICRKIFHASSQRYFRESKINYSHKLYHLSQSVRIEDRSYDGPLLHPEHYPGMSKNKEYRMLQTTYMRTAPGRLQDIDDSDVLAGSLMSRRDRLLYDVIDALVDARPDILPLPSFLLTHFHTPDLELQTPCQLDEGDPGEKYDNLHRLQNKNTVREAIVAHAGNAYQMVRLRDGKIVPMLRQYHAMRARQLRALGATVTEIPHFEFEASVDKPQYLLKKFREQDHTP